MNKVTIVKEKEIYRPGDLFISQDGELIMIIDGFKDHEFYSICLDVGIIWTGPSKTANDTVKNLKFIGRNMEIVIKAL